MTTRTRLVIVAAALVVAVIAAVRQWQADSGSLAPPPAQTTAVTLV